MTQYAHVLHLHQGVLSEHAIDPSALLQQALNRIIKGGQRLIAVVPCPSLDANTLDYVVVTEHEVPRG